jgi:hypothetical protein
MHDVKCVSVFSIRPMRYFDTEWEQLRFSKLGGGGWRTTDKGWERLRAIRLILDRTMQQNSSNQHAVQLQRAKSLENISH